MNDRRERMVAAAVGLGLFVVFVAGWKLYVEASGVSRFVLPPPEAAGRATIELLGERRTWEHGWLTVRVVALSFGIATAGGLLVGTLLGELRVLDRALAPYVIGLQVIPKVAIIPLLLLWLGFGAPARIVIATLFAFFPIFAGVRAGIRSAEQGHRDLATSLQASTPQRLLLITLPAAMPATLTGMEVGVVLATVGAVVAEYLAGSEGLGYLAMANLNELKIDRLFGIIILLSVVGVAMYAAIGGLRRVVVPWHASASPSGAGALAREHRRRRGGIPRSHPYTPDPEGTSP